MLLYWLALWLNWDLPKYGALAIALISLDTTGASLQKGVMRMAGTTVGLAVGLLGLALFAQDIWLTLVYHASYLVVVGYYMQSSRYPYAWYVAGFLPSLVWATTYGKIDNAFSYATFRYLETSAGIVIYTAVNAMIWPRNAGDVLNRQGHDFWQQFQGLFGLYRRQLENGQLPTDAQERRAKLVGIGTKMLATLEASYSDTPSVAAQKHVWERFRVNARVVSDVMELWRQCIDDCRHLDLDVLLPTLHPSLDKLDQRLSRLDQLWQVRSAAEAVSDVDDRDEALLARETLELDLGPIGELSHLDRAAVLSFVQQFNLLLLTSGKLLRTMRVLAGVAPASSLESHSLPTDLYRPSRWDPARFASGLLPALCFIVCYFFWIHFNPPTGPSVPNMAATFGLIVVLTPMNALVLIPFALVAMWGFVAPVYFLVMPQLSTGPELLAFVFVFAFVVSVLLVGRLAALKTLVLAFFAMMTGISNEQKYSFTGLVDGALMILLAVGVIAIVQTLVSPLKPERALLKSVRRFFLGCARVTHGYGLDGSVNRNAADQARGRRMRKRAFQSMVLPAAAKVQSAHGRLDGKLYPDNPPEKVQRLIDALQCIADRLQALEIVQQRFADRASSLPESFTSLVIRVRDNVESVFKGWAKLDSRDAKKHQHAELRKIARDLAQRFEELVESRSASEVDDRLLVDLYALIGTVRGLVDAMVDTQDVISQINWHQWATPRF